MKKDVYGFVNGTPCYSRDEYVYAGRGMGPILSDEDLVTFAQKVTWGWSQAGHKSSFEGFVLSEYALSEPKRSLTEREFGRLRELQRQALQARAAAEAARGWTLVETTHWADNSVEETWVDREGSTKTVMTVAPHGDRC